MVEETKERLRRILAEYPHTAVLASFGKDSLTILYLLMEMGIRKPVVYFREVSTPWKDRFVFDRITAWNLEVYMPPHESSGLRSSDKENCLIRNYRIGGGLIEVPRTLVHDPKAPICGASLYNSPSGAMELPWGSYLHGHKSSDIDATYGHVPLNTYSHVADNGLTVHFPLRDWADDDIWAYLSTKTGAPTRRDYEERNPILKNDVIQACTACMFKGASQVFCPKVGYGIANAHERFTVIPKLTPAYIGTS